MAFVVHGYNHDDVFYFNLEKICTHVEDLALTMRNYKCNKK